MMRYQVIKYTRRKHGLWWRRVWSPEHTVLAESDDLRGAIDYAVAYDWFYANEVIFVRDTDNGRRVFEKAGIDMQADTPLRG